MNSYNLTEHQKFWIRDILNGDKLDTVSTGQMWWNFTKGNNMQTLEYNGNYWNGFTIKDKLVQILDKGNYTDAQRVILNSVGQFILNKDKIQKINRL